VASIHMAGCDPAEDVALLRADRAVEARRASRLDIGKAPALDNPWPRQFAAVSAQLVTFNQNRWWPSRGIRTTAHS
jgi:hypothetical protein